MELSVLYDNALVAFFILLVGLIIGKFVQRITLRSMKELEVSYLFRKATKLKVSLDWLVSTIVAYLIYGIALFLALTTLGLLNWTLIILGVGLLLFLLVGTFLYFISLFPNLWARFSLRKNDFEKGKMLEMKNVKGKIKRTSLQFVYLENGTNLPFYYLSKNKFKVN